MLSQDVLTRAAAGLLLAGGIAVVSHRVRSLSRSGAIAATIVGTISAAAGWSWGILLIAFFITGTVLSRIGETGKAKRLSSIVSKAGERDAWQVAANGAVYGLAALAFIYSGDTRFRAIAIGALAAAAADTWATEIGTLGTTVPRLITSGERVPAGTSGGISAKGTIASVAAAICAAGGAILAGWGIPCIATITGGLAGAFLDSVLGATLQSRRRCDSCDTSTERLLHSCGNRTRVVGGIELLNNDAVNFAATVAGGLVALAITMTLGAR